MMIVWHKIWLYKDVLFFVEKPTSFLVGQVFKASVNEFSVISVLPIKIALLLSVVDYS